MRTRLLCLAFLSSAFCLQAQLYSPKVTKQGQVDTSSLSSLTDGIYRQAGARTAREKAEAIWRFFLTDGRFVKPGFWYHIAGWAYEEPKGEVLDPISLLNSYGFGLCYHIAPLLEAVFEAGGFSDARVWFLTGHTVAEVFYDGAYHYFDSDMMGYNPIGSGPLKQRPVASVRQLEHNARIMLDNLNGPREIAKGRVDSPWYPADVKEAAMDDLAGLFTSTQDNWLFPFKRYSEGRTMDFTLRPGERLIRYFHPADDHLYYLPFSFDGTAWTEFPKEISHYNIKTEDGPRSQKDTRTWSTGAIEYRPPISDQSVFTIAMPSPYVIIDAQFAMNVNLPATDSLTVDVSPDDGRTWSVAGVLSGPFNGRWKTEPPAKVSTPHGKLTVISGSYGYQARFRSGHAAITDLLLTTRFSVNPRSLPLISPGHNELNVTTSQATRYVLPIRADRVKEFAHVTSNIEPVFERGQGFIRNGGGKPGEVTFLISAPDEIAGVDIGGRFLDLRDGLAPDKLTAEVRHVQPWPGDLRGKSQSAAISWSVEPSGPWHTAWTYDSKLVWKDNDVINRTLRWPEVDERVQSLPPGTHRVYARYSFMGIAIDDFRLAYRTRAQQKNSGTVTHIWMENGKEKRFSRAVQGSAASYSIDVPNGAAVENVALILESPLNSK